jgi:hypothetical protein
MKANLPERNYDGQAKDESVGTMPLRIEEINFLVEENEEVIAPGEEITIRIERIEEIISPNSNDDHNQAKSTASTQ